LEAFIILINVEFALFEKILAIISLQHEAATATFP